MKPTVISRVIITLFIMWFSTTNIVNAQIADKGQDTKPSISDEEPLKQWQVSIDLSPVVIGLSGGHNPSVNHIGFQVKRLSGNNGIRFFARIYPYHQWFDNSTSFLLIDESKPQPTYLVLSYTNFIARTGIGYEHGFDARWGRKYFGIDVSAVMDQKTLSAWDFVGNPANRNDLMEGLSQAKTDVSNSYGIGICPFIGYELQAWKHLGFNVEIKPDIVVTAGKSIGVDDDLNFHKSGYTYHLRTFPLFDFRLHYRF